MERFPLKFAEKGKNFLKRINQTAANVVVATKTLI